MKIHQDIKRKRKRWKRPRNQREQLWRRSHGQCWYCGRSVGLKAFRLDHQDPFSKGGADGVRNLVVACAPCDDAKGVLTLEEFRQKQGRIQFYGERLHGQG